MVRAVLPTKNLTGYRGKIMKYKEIIARIYEDMCGDINHSWHEIVETLEDGAALAQLGIGDDDLDAVEEAHDYAKKMAAKKFVPFHAITRRDQLLARVNAEGRLSLGNRAWHVSELLSEVQTQKNRVRVLVSYSRKFSGATEKYFWI